MKTSEIIEFCLEVGLLAVVVVGIAIVIRRLWLAITNPQIARQLGRKARRAVEGAAHTAGRAIGTAEGAVGFVGRSFRDGRDMAKGKEGVPDSDA